MISSPQDYRDYLEADRRALGRKRTRPWLFVLDPVWCFQRLLRRTEFVCNCRTSPLWRPYAWFLRYRLKRMQIRLGFCIPLNTIGPGLCIAHAGPIIIHDAVRIGAGLRVNVGVVIGENRDGEVPTIGSQVVIEPGAKLFGKIFIADGTHIGANAVVNQSFTEPGFVIAGVPARKIKANPEFPRLPA